MAPIFISRKMQAQGDSANLAVAVLYSGVIVLFWDLFRPVNGWLSPGVAILNSTKFKGNGKYISIPKSLDVRESPIDGG